MLQNLESNVWKPMQISNRTSLVALLWTSGRVGESKLEIRQMNWKGECRGIKFYSPESAD